MRPPWPPLPSTLTIEKLLFLDLDRLPVTKRVRPADHHHGFRLNTSENLHIGAASLSGGHGATLDDVTLEHKNIFGGVVLANGLLRHQRHGSGLFFFRSGFRLVLQEGDLHAHVRSDARIPSTA